MVVQRLIYLTVEHYGGAFFVKTVNGLLRDGRQW